MLTLTLQDRGDVIATAHVFNASDLRPTSDYGCAVLCPAVGTVARSEVAQYPRFSAPVEDLVLRAVAAALWGEERLGRLAAYPTAPQMPPLLEATIQLVPGGVGRAKTLARWTLMHADGVLTCWAIDECDESRWHAYPRLDAHGAWGCLLSVWCHWLFGVPDIGARFPPPSVGVRRFRGIEYVRLRDIPRHVRHLVEWRCARPPFVPEVDDAVLAADLPDWLRRT